MEVQPVGPEEPEPRANLVRERQAPEHPKYPITFKSLLEYVISIDALSIGVVMKPLLHFTPSLSR